MMLVLSLTIILGGRIVLFRQSPYFGIFGVLIQALSLARLLSLFGFPFFALLLVLIYVGGMLIIFLFSTVLSAERYPSSGWEQILVFSFILRLCAFPIISCWAPSLEALSRLTLYSENILGVAFGPFGYITLLVVYILLIALVVVLYFGFEHSRESIRKI